MEIDFGDFCFISPDQEDLLESGACLGLGESEVLSEEEEELSQSSGEQAADSTGVFMASPEVSTQVVRSDSITPPETYHTPPEEAAPRSSSSVEEEAVFGNGGCRDEERVVDLGRDDDLGIPERTEMAVQQLSGADERSETGKAGLKRGPCSDDRPSKKLEVELYVETPDEYAGIFREKLIEALEEAVESLKVYGPMVLRGIKIHRGTLIRRKLNSTVKLEDAPKTVDLEVEGSEYVPEPVSSTDTVMLDDAPTIADLEFEESENVPEPDSSTDEGEFEESSENVPEPDSSTDEGEFEESSENVPEPYSSTDEGESDQLIGTDSAQITRGAEVRDAADVPNFTYGGKDLPFCDKGKEVAEHHTIGIRDREQLKSHAGDDQRGERSSEINATVEMVRGLGCDTGPNAAEMDCVRGAESIEKIENLGPSSGKDTPMRNKGKAIAESEEIGIRRGQNLRAQANDDGEGQRSAEIDIQKDKDGSQHKQDGRDSVGSVTDVEVIGVSRKEHRRDIKNIEEIEKFRYNREKGSCLQDKGKAVAGQEEIHVSGGKSSKVQNRDDHEGQTPMEIDCGDELSQNMSVKDNNSSKSSDIDENLRTLPASIQELAQHAPARVKASSSGLLKVNELGILNILGQVAEACEGGHDLEEGSIVDFAEKLGITFPRPKRRGES